LTQEVKLKKALTWFVTTVKISYHASRIEACQFLQLHREWPM